MSKLSQLSCHSDILVLYIFISCHSAPTNSQVAIIFWFWSRNERLNSQREKENIVHFTYHVYLSIHPSSPHCVGRPLLVSGCIPLLWQHGCMERCRSTSCTGQAYLSTMVLFWVDKITLVIYGSLWRIVGIFRGRENKILDVRPHTCIYRGLCVYSGNSLIRTPFGTTKVSWLEGCPHFGGCFVHIST